MAVLVAIATLPTAAAENATARGTGYEIAITSRTESRANTPSELVLSIAPSDGRKINEDYPLKIAISAPSDVMLAKRTLGRSDARRVDAKGVELPIAFTPKTSGERTIAFDVRFAVCSSTACEPQRRTVTLALRVQ